MSIGIQNKQLQTFLKKSLICIVLIHFSCKAQLPKGFSYIKDSAPNIQSELRYLGTNNFVGKKIDGYEKNTLITSTKTAKALKKVQHELEKIGLGLKVFDAYRPQSAVNHFVRWAKKPSDTLKKQTYYPKINKKNLFKLGFISSRSGHSRGSSVDLTLVNLRTKKEIPMGSPYDFFGEISGTYTAKIHKAHRYNRLLLRSFMVKYGFRPYSKKEWWHFTLRNEPFPKSYFNFPIK